ncbi:hypothetical protein R3P38DRAFT_1360618 [Favolaschia claudopus]|uniref:Sushi domain-containing protein n=1 Tax=Favolaschia claudopus TaxID=2862362 RepID=A0AAW0DVN0_9AGAR
MKSNMDVSSANIRPCLQCSGLFPSIDGNGNSPHALLTPVSRSRLYLRSPKTWHGSFSDSQVLPSSGGNPNLNFARPVSRRIFFGRFSEMHNGNPEKFCGELAPRQRGEGRSISETERTATYCYLLLPSQKNRQPQPSDNSFWKILRVFVAVYTNSGTNATIKCDDDTYGIWELPVIACLKSHSLSESSTVPRTAAFLRSTRVRFINYECCRVLYLDLHIKMNY